MDKQLVKVVWNDAHAALGSSMYAEHEIPHKALMVSTIGWLLRQDAEGVSIANEYCEDATFRGYTFIPTGMIKSVGPILKPRKPRLKPTILLEKDER